MRFEIVEHAKDEKGERMTIATYEVEQVDLSRTIDRLEEDVRNGRIEDFEIATVG